MSDENRQLLLRERPLGVVTDECFEMARTAVPQPGDGQILVRTLWLGFEPAMRGWLNDIRSYTPPVGIGEVMRAWGIGQVVDSRHPDHAVGSLVHGDLGWQDYALLDGGDTGIERVPGDISDPRLMLSVAGLTGLTAYFGMTEVGRPEAGDVVLVTAAAGATGSVAAQIARALGAGRVIGTAGSPEKRDWVREVAGLDDCLDHHDPEVRRAIRSAAPEGLNVVFDNVGGSLLDAALFNIAVGARIALCGSISTGYRPERPEVGIHYYQLLTTRRSRMEGFLVSDHSDRYTEARQRLLDWVADGSIRVEYDVLDGLEHAPEGIRRLFEGKNLGKQLLHVADPG